jgi:carbonyl reductase 1
LHPLYHKLDTTSPEDIAQFRDYIQATYRGLDILVNNAGIAFKNDSTAPFSEQGWCLFIGLKPKFFPSPRPK